MYNHDDVGALFILVVLVGQMGKNVICSTLQTLCKQPLRPKKNPQAALAVKPWTNKLVRKLMVDALLC